MWNKFLKPAVNVAAPFIGMAVGAKTKSPKVAQATAKILKSIWGPGFISMERDFVRKLCESHFK